MLQEKFLILPSLNGSELLRSLARRGINTFLLRAMSPVELARFALMRSGRPIPGTLLSAGDEVAVMARAMEGIGYFSSSYAEAEAVTAAVRSMHQLLPHEEGAGIVKALLPGRFPDKNRALYAAYINYTAICDGEGLTDAISLMRMALEAPPLTGCGFTVLQEDPLSPLEEALLMALSGGSYTEKTIPALFGAGQKPLCIKDIARAYGASNEAEDILGQILESGAPLDSCVIAAANTAEYAQLFFDLSQQHNIPMTFGCGVPISNTNPAKLLKLLHHWDTLGCHGKDALSDLLYSPSFNREELQKRLDPSISLDSIIELAGDLQLSMDGADNRRKLRALEAAAPSAVPYRLMEATDILFHEFARGHHYMVERYSVIRGGAGHLGRIDRSASKVIGDALTSYTRYFGKDVSRMLPSLFKKTVSSENSREGFLHITSIEAARHTLRDRLFTAGLSARHFPGSPRENPLLLDYDYMAFPVSPERLPTSENMVERKKQALWQLGNIAACLDISLCLSYSAYSLSELKSENPSSALFALYREQAGEQADFSDFEGTLRPVGYFPYPLSKTEAIGQAYACGFTSIIPPAAGEQPLLKAKADKAFSPSAIELFFTCPRLFALRCLLGVKAEEPEDPNAFLTPAAFGELAHAVMEKSANLRLSKDDFMALAEREFEGYAARRPRPAEQERARQDFLSVMENAYDTDPGNKVVLAEEAIRAFHPAGVWLSGRPDRLEKTPDGRYIVVDYKTGQNILHMENDPDTCLQTLLYAYLLGSRNIDVSACEYRYIRSSKKVQCKNNAAMQQAVTDRLAIFAAALAAGQYDFAADEKQCLYCVYNGLCTPGKGGSHGNQQA